VSIKRFSLKFAFKILYTDKGDGMLNVYRRYTTLSFVQDDRIMPALFTAKEREREREREGERERERISRE